VIAPDPVWSAMVLGLLFGVQHATDPDHVVAVATIVARTRRFAAGALVGFGAALGREQLVRPA